MKLHATPSLMGFFFLVFLSSCLSEGDQTGLCQTSDGNTVNTHQLVGTWKLIDGDHAYEERDGVYLTYEARSRSQIAKGSNMCITEVDNGSPKCLLLSGAYDHYPSDGRYEADYQSINSTADCNPYQVPSSEDVEYSFGGSCNDTKLTLKYPNGGSEVFQWRGSTGSCQSQ